MSKPVVGQIANTFEFGSALETVSDSVVAAQRRGGNAKLKAGLDAMFERARSEGFSAGLVEGRFEGKQEGVRNAEREFHEAHRSEIERFHLALEAFVERANESVEAWYLEAEQTLTALAIEIARRALCSELETSRESILAITHEALEEVRHGTSVRIRVNPVDASILESHREEILAKVSGIRGLEVVPDLHIAGGCEIETDGGVIDARVHSYLARLAQEAA